MLKVQKHIVYEKSREMLSGLKHGLSWVEPLDREVAHIEGQEILRP